MKTLTPDEISALWDSPEEEEEEQGFVWDYDDPDVDSVYDQIKKYEYDTGTRGKRHNNPGAHIWTPEVQEKFGAGKGDSFVDEEGKTYHTAEYDTLEQGVEATKFLIDRKLKKGKGNHNKYLRGKSTRKNQKIITTIRRKDESETCYEKNY